MGHSVYVARGSQRWLQIAINKAPDVLRASLVASGAVECDAPVTWAAPIASDGFAEPRDEEALRKAGITSLTNRSLGDYWPRRGPVWDAVGRTGSASLFVEAKAHLKEVESPPSQASSASLARITASLAEAREFYTKGSAADWHLIYYQYANRLAHHYLLTQLNGCDSRLVFLYFLNAVDMGGPSRVDEWESATNRVHAALGLPGHLTDVGVYHAYLDVDALPEVD